MITDGLSNTLMASESGARHEGWAIGKRYADVFQPPRGAWAIALPAIVALAIKLVQPDRPLLISGRAMVFLLVTMVIP